jgi:methylated-DNA-[protein]-cysteine S-methyltransferase
VMLVKDKIWNYDFFQTDVGWVGVVGSENGIKRVILPLESRRSLLDRIVGYGCRLENRDSDSLADLVNRLKQYFHGQPVEFRDELDLDSASDFEKAVWRVVRSIPRGQTRSYGWVAKEMGLQKAARAVGQAMGRNPVPIVVPCHRVIRGDGSFGGFGGGLKLKKYLLHLEQLA